METYLALGNCEDSWYCARCSLSPLSESFFGSPSVSHHGDHPSAGSNEDDHVVDSPGLKDVTKRHKNGYLFCHLNVRSLHRCFDEIHDHITPIRDGKLFLSLSETWLDPKLPDGVVSIPGYCLFRRDRGGRGGGVAMYCPDSSRCKRREDLESSILEAIWIETRINRRKPMLVCTVYRPPDCSCQFFEEFSAMLDNASKESKEILVMGDMNINYLSDCTISRRMRSMCEEFSLTQMITEPTRVTQNSMTLIDHILSSYPCGFLESGCLDVGVSDHLLVYAVKLGESCQGHKFRNVRAYRKCNMDALLEDLQGAKWESDNQNIDDMWDQWKKVFLGIVDRHAPIVRCRVRKKSLPWIDANIRKNMRKRNLLHNRAKRTSSAELWDRYRSLRNKVTGELRQAKRSFFVSLTSKSSRRGTWKHLNRLLGRGKGSAPVADLGLGSDVTRRFSDHFSRGASSSQGTLPPPEMPRYSTSFNFDSISREQLAQALANLDTKKATGMDGISAWLLKATAPAICDSLCDLFNSSLQLSQIPSEWKAARVIPVPKTSRARSVEDFRPISILSIVAKVFESLVHAQVSRYFEKFNMMHEAQSGFRPYHCTQDVLLKTVDDWRSSLERNEIVGSVFIDLSKAFDSINHCLLLQKLALYGFRDESLEWFKNYLSGRRQSVAYGDEMSEWVDVSTGVPQGSILGPLLFTIFVNDLPATLHSSKVMLYADDTTVYFADQCSQRVEEVLSEDLGRLAS